MLRATPLVDEDLSEHLRTGARRRLKDADYKAEVTARCLSNAEAKKGKPRGGGMSQAGKAALAKRNAEANQNYLKQQAPKVAKVLREKKTLHDVRRELGMSETTTKKIVAMGEATYSKDVALEIGRQRAAEARLRNRVS